MYWFCSHSNVKQNLYCFDNSTSYFGVASLPLLAFNWTELSSLGQGNAKLCMTPKFWNKAAPLISYVSEKHAKGTRKGWEQ